MSNKKDKSAPCPCGQPSFAQCCGRFLSGAQVPATAELLMRSRYSAYALRDEAYLRATWFPDTLPEEELTSEDVEGTDALTADTDGIGDGIVGGGATHILNDGVDKAEASDHIDTDENDGEGE